MSLRGRGSFILGCLRLSASKMVVVAMGIKSALPEAAEEIGVRLGVAFSRIPLTPNQWTVISVIPAMLGFIALAYYKEMGAGLALFAFSALLDAVDGGVARVTGSVSNLGAYLDGMADRVVEGLLLFGLMLFGLPDISIYGYSTPMWLWLSMLLFVGSAMVSYSRAYADHRKVLGNARLKRMGGILERAERLLLVFAGMALFYLNSGYLGVLIVLAGLLSCVTLAQRVWFVARNAE